MSTFKRRARRQRLWQRRATAARAVTEDESFDELARETFAAFIAAYDRWQAATEPLHGECPICGAPIIVQPGQGESTISHALPTCDPWMPTLIALGAHTPRETTITFN